MKDLLPWTWMIVAVAMLYIGAWPVALIAFGGGLLSFISHGWVEKHYRRQEAFGSPKRAARNRRGDAMFDFVLSAFLLFGVFVIIAVVNGWDVAGTLERLVP